MASLSILSPPSTTYHRRFCHLFTRLIQHASPFNIRSPTKTDNLKRLAANKAIDYVQSGMILSLSTGSTTVVSKLSQILSTGQFSDIIEISTSKHTEEQAKSLGIPLSVLDEHPKIDLAIDGVNEVNPNLNLIKGRGRALLREKMVEAASEKFVVVVDETKLVSGLGGSSLAMPVEVMQFYWKYNLERLRDLFKEEGCEAKLRLVEEGEEPYVTDSKTYIVEGGDEERRT